MNERYPVDICILAGGIRFIDGPILRITFSDFCKQISASFEQSSFFFFTSVCIV